MERSVVNLSRGSYEVVESEKISVTEFAKMMGVTAAAVSRAITAKRLVKCLSNRENGRYEIDTAIGKEEWEANRLRMQRNGEPDDDDEGVDENRKKLVEIELKSKHYQAETARMKFEEMSGQLLNAGEVRKELDRVLRLVRDGLLALPDRVAAEVSVMTAEFEVRKRIEDEVRDVLQNLAFKIKTPDEEEAPLEPE